MLGPAIIRFNVYQRYSFWIKRHWNLVNVSINKQTISQCDSDRIIGVWPNIGIFTLRPGTRTHTQARPLSHVIVTAIHRQPLFLVPCCRAPLRHRHSPPRQRPILFARLRSLLQPFVPCHRVVAEGRSPASQRILLFPPFAVTLPPQFCDFYVRHLSSVTCHYYVSPPLAYKVLGILFEIPIHQLKKRSKQRTHCFCLLALFVLFHRTGSDQNFRGHSCRDLYTFRVQRLFQKPFLVAYSHHRYRV